MGCYKVRFEDYSLAHYDDFKYYNYFEFRGKKYPIGAYVNLTKRAEYDMLHNRGHGFIKGNFRLVDHFINDKGNERWEYIIGKSHKTNSYYFHTTSKSPDELLNNVLGPEIDETVYLSGELKVEFKEPNYFPKDWEVKGVMLGWFIYIIFWISLFVLKDVWIRVIIQIITGLYFGKWRDNKINEAIKTQNFKK